MDKVREALHRIVELYEGERTSPALDLLFEARNIAREALSQSEGWRPIETAPKDGTPILVWDGDNPTTAKWVAEYSLWEICVPSEGYRDSDWVEPILWMPLPPLPNKEMK